MGVGVVVGWDAAAWSSRRGISRCNNNDAAVAVPSGSLEPPPGPSPGPCADPGPSPGPCADPGPSPGACADTSASPVTSPGPSPAPDAAIKRFCGLEGVRGISVRLS